MSGHCKFCSLLVVIVAVSLSRQQLFTFACALSIPLRILPVKYESISIQNLLFYCKLFIISLFLYVRIGRLQLPKQIDNSLLHIGYQYDVIQFHTMNCYISLFIICVQMLSAYEVLELKGTEMLSLGSRLYREA